jgi:hypothetical protein
VGGPGLRNLFALVVLIGFFIGGVWFYATSLRAARAAVRFAPPPASHARFISGDERCAFIACATP